VTNSQTYPGHPRPPLDERLADLIISAETDAIDTSDSAELARLLPAADATEVAALRRSIFTARAAIRGHAESPLSAALRQRLINAAPAATSSIPSAAEPKPLRLTREPEPSRFTFVAISGWLAAAAAIGFAAVLWFGAPAANPRDSGASFAAAKLAEVDARPDTLRLAFKPNVDHLSNVTGEVVWNDALQTGYMTFKGLPKNDATRRQYQLWIIDPARDARPVDGGIFDIAGDNVRIPIDAKLAVNKPTTFAITAEQPGGVVVSAGPLLVVATRG